MQELELDVASEYLVMAATLVQIKSKMLLPSIQDDVEDDLLYDPNEEDPREELMNRLIEYRKYKEAARDLEQLEGNRSHLHMKHATDISHFIPKQIPLSDRLSPLSIYDMVQAYQTLLKRKRLEAPLERTVKAQEYSIEERMNEIMLQLSNKKGKHNFFDLFPKQDRKSIIITFLAILELMKVKAVQCEQKGNFSEIIIMSCEEEKHCSFTI